MDQVQDNPPMSLTNVVQAGYDMPVTWSKLSPEEHSRS